MEKCECGCEFTGQLPTVFLLTYLEAQEEEEGMVPDSVYMSFLAKWTSRCASWWWEWAGGSRKGGANILFFAPSRECVLLPKCWNIGFLLSFLLCIASCTWKLFMDPEGLTDSTAWPSRPSIIWPQVCVLLLPATSYFSWQMETYCGLCQALFWDRSVLFIVPLSEPYGCKSLCYCPLPFFLTSIWFLVVWFIDANHS